MQDEKENMYANGDEQEIDLLELAQKLWTNRRTIIKWGAIGAIVGIVVAFSIPKEYTTTVKLAPEVSSGSKGNMGGLGALASMAGINMGSGATSDAVYPTLYPDIVGSVPFTVGLFDVKVNDVDGDNRMELREYVENELRSPWWSVILSLPGKAIGGVMSLLKDDDDEVAGDSINSFHLTKDEYGIVDVLSHRIGADVDTKTSVVTVSVTMQDPMVSAMLADTVVERLKEYVTDYRTNKARQDMAYAQKLTDEARDDYYAAQQRYASYVDKNHGIASLSGRTETERLQNEMQLAFNLYNSMAQQLQMAKAKVQEITPVYAVVQPATVPLLASKPSKMLILVGFVFLAVVAASAWILFGKDILERFKSGTSKEDTVSGESGK